VNLDQLTPMDDADRDQLRQRLIDAEFAEPAPPPAYTVLQAWQDYGTPRDWREAIAFAAFPFLESSPTYKALQARWSDAIDRVRDEGPPFDAEAIARGEYSAWSVADAVCAELAGLCCELGAVAGFALGATWTGEIADLPDWLGRALTMANLATYGR
jgi:hypothetical protein